MFEKVLSLATRQNLVRSLLGALLFMVAMNLGATAFFRYTHGVGLLDLAGGANLLDNRAGGYSPESAYQMIAAYGSQGIRYHLMLSTADIFFPPTLAFFLLIATLFFYEPIFKTRPATRWLAALPILYLACDYLENAGIAVMLLSFPSKAAGMAHIANFMFMGKNLTSSLAIAIILLELVLRGIQRARRKGTEERSPTGYLTGTE